MAKDEFYKPTCFICGHPMIWDCDNPVDEICGNSEDYDDGAIVSTWHCSFCGRDNEYWGES